ncbi:MAG: hypothetical protein AAF828_00830 [Bacteroidota bacterium]
MAFPGKLEKMIILGFKDVEHNEPSSPRRQEVLVNPETYSQEYTIEYNTDTAQGEDGAEAKYTRHSPSEFSCDLWFDNTGIIDGKPQPDIHDQLDTFKKFLLDLEEETHEPRHFKIIWGKMLFNGRLTALNVEYKLFKPDGTPIRAKATVTFVGSFDDVLRQARSNLQSPDLTHQRIVHAGETLANLCQEIYGDVRYVNTIARLNELNSFRRVEVGQVLFFPPFAKN